MTRQIALWFDSGVRDGADFMIIARDTFSAEDFPIYVRGSAEFAAQRTREIETMPMYRALGVYSLKSDRDVQLATAECWAVPKPEPGPETRLVEDGIRELTARVGWKA